MYDRYIREYVSTLLKHRMSQHKLNEIKTHVTDHDFLTRLDPNSGSAWVYRYSDAPLTENERILFAYMEGMLQLNRILNGSVDDWGIRHRNIGVLGSRFNLLVYHTSNENILKSVNGFLYCTMCPYEAIQMWSSLRARKRCYYVNIFEASVFDDLRWCNGDVYEREHGGRLLIDASVLRPVDYVEKSSLGVSEDELISKYKVSSFTREFDNVKRWLYNPFGFKTEEFDIDIDTRLSLDSICKSLIEQGVLKKIMESEE